MSTPIVYLNGHLLPQEEASISVLDHGLLYGHAIFETVRTYQGKPFRLGQHLTRLERGAHELGITPHMEDLTAAVAAIVDANSLSDARVRITLTAGEGGTGPATSPARGPNLVLTASPLDPTPDEAYEKGHAAIISSIRRSSSSSTARVKTTNLVEGILARREAGENEADQAIMLNEKRCVTECPAANIFFVAYGGLITPSVDCGLLPGVTRDAIIDLALAQQISIDERWVSVEEIWDAEEIFVTSSVIEVLPVTSVNGRKVHGGSPGKVTRALTMAYRDLVTEQLGLARAAQA